ncbi:hypothetical protein MRX96_018713 [Rhipicephalus microplus]
MPIYHILTLARGKSSNTRSAHESCTVQVILSFLKCPGSLRWVLFNTHNTSIQRPYASWPVYQREEGLHHPVLVAALKYFMNFVPTSCPVHPIGTAALPTHVELASRDKRQT